jgi:ADP-ribosylglycohydrolase
LYHINSFLLQSFHRRFATGIHDDQEKNFSVKDFGEYVGSGAYVLETDAAFLYIISKHLDNPQETILQAVNFTGDNDAVASIVDAVAGAAYGKKAFKSTWIKNLSGRTRERDDGTMFRMI